MDPPALSAPLVTTETQDTTDSQANLETVVLQLDQLPNWFPNPQSNARAKLLQEMLAHPDQRELMDHLVMQAPLALMANPEIKDHVAHPDLPDPLVDLETREEQETQAKSVLANPAQLVLLEATANPALEAPLANPARQAKMALQVPQALPEMLELEAAPERLVLLAHLEMQAKEVHPEAASTAHQLVWLQDTKHLQKWLESINCQKRDEVFQVFQSLLFFFSFHVRKIRDSQLSLLLHLK